MLLLDLHLILLFLPQLLALLQLLLLLLKIEDLYPLVLGRWLIERVNFGLLRVHDVDKLVVLASVDEPLVLIILPVAQSFLTHLFFQDTSTNFERVIFLENKIQILDFALVFHFES